MEMLAQPVVKALPATIGVYRFEVTKEYSEVVKSFGYGNVNSEVFK